MNSLMKNKRGSLFDIIAWVAFALFVILFLGLWLYAHNLLTLQLESLGSVTVGNSTINISQISTQTFGQINTAEQTWLPIIAFILIATEGFTILIANYFVKEHPLLFVPYILVIGVAVVIAAYISNAYQGFLTGFAFSGQLQSMSMANYIMIYLPWWTGVIGAFGLIFLLANIAGANPTA